jgi:hypothetical protein
MDTQRRAIARACDSPTVEPTQREPTQRKHPHSEDTGSHALCQCNTLTLAYGNESTMRYSDASVSKWRDVSTMRPRCGKRGASAMRHGVPGMRYDRLSKSKRTSCEKVSRPRRAPYTVGALCAHTHGSLANGH